MENLAPTPTSYPYMIARACSALEEAQIFQDLPDGYFRIIFRIIKKINVASPFSKIVATRTTLSKESGKSIETVQRAIKWLEARGLIEEREQKANVGLRGSRSPLTPTRKFLDALGLLEAPRARQKTQRGMDEHPTASEASAPEQAKPQRSTSSQHLVRIGKIALPADLAWLCTSNGMPATGVLKLMTLAKASQQRLSTVVGATRKYLEGLQGRELFAYINALLSKGKDFSYVAKISEISEKSEQERQYLKEKAEMLEGRAFSTADGERTLRVEGGVLVEVKNGTRVIRMMSLKFLEAIEAGRLRERWACA